MKSIHSIENQSIKAQLPLSTVLQHYGGQCANKTSGSWWCVLHETGGKSKGHKTPSLVAKDNIGTATCMSQGCFEADDIFGIIAKMEQLDLKNDFLEIKKRACVMANIPFEENNSQNAFKSILKHEKSSDVEIYQNENKNDFMAIYESNTSNSTSHPTQDLQENHLEYLKSFGISKETAEYFGLKSRYDYILYPQIENSTLLGYKGISIIKDENTGKRKMFFDDRAKATVWHEGNIPQNKHLVFVEGEKDCMRLTDAIKQEGRNNEYIALTITTGAKTIPQNIAEKVKSFNPESVSILYDNDTAGKEGSKKLAQSLVEQFKSVCVYSFNQENKEGYDITDFLNEGGKFNDIFQLEKEIISQEKPNLASSSFFNNPNISFQFGDLKQTPPPINWLIQGFLAEHKVGSVIAKGSTGKSWFLLQLAVSVASGTDFMGIKNPNQGGNVLYIMGEEDKDDIHRRIASIKESYQSKGGFENEEMTNKNLSFLCVNGKNVTLNKESELRKDLKTYIEIHRPKLIILDPAIRFFEGDENSSNDATKFVEILEELKNMGTTILFAHHTGKMMADILDQHSARGSSAFIDASRWNIVLKKIHKKDADKYCFESDESFLDPELCDLYVNAEIVKCNGFKPIENEFTFKRDKNGVLHRNQKLIPKS